MFKAFLTVIIPTLATPLLYVLFFNVGFTSSSSVLLSAFSSLLFTFFYGRYLLNVYPSFCKVKTIYILGIVWLFVLTVIPIMNFIMTNSFLWQVNENYEFDLWLFLGYALVAPIGEELVFRSIFLEYCLKEEVNKVFAIGGSSILFGLGHAPGLENVMAYFFFSVVLALVYLKYRNLFLIILLHFVNNIIPDLLFFIKNY